MSSGNARLDKALSDLGMKAKPPGDGWFRTGDTLWMRPRPGCYYRGWSTPVDDLEFGSPASQQAFEAIAADYRFVSRSCKHRFVPSGTIPPGLEGMECLHCSLFVVGPPVLS